MLALLLAAALAADFDGHAFGAPFSPKVALGTPHESRPGVLLVTVTDAKATCAAQKVKNKDATALVVAFDVETGAFLPPPFLLHGKQGFGQALTGTARVEGMPSAAGGQGNLVLDLRGETDRAVGAVPFELCAVVAPATPPQSAFPVGAEDLGDVVVQVGRPTEWTFVPSEVFPDRRTWRAPDGGTTFELSSSCMGGCEPKDFAENAKGWGADQIKAFAEPPWEAKLLADTGGDGWHVVRWSRAHAGAEPTVQLVVMRWGEGWPEMGLCTVTTREKYAAFLDRAEEACKAMERAP